MSTKHQKDKSQRLALLYCGMMGHRFAIITPDGTGGWRTHGETDDAATAREWAQDGREAWEHLPSGKWRKVAP